MNIQIVLFNRFFFGIFLKKNYFMSLMFCNMNILYTWTPSWQNKERRLLVYDEEDIEASQENIIKIARINQYLKLDKDSIFAIYSFK